MIKDWNNVNLIFLGAPGAGKGTIAEKLSLQDNFAHLSTGAMFREEINAKTPLGLQVVELTSNGLYVSDEITNQLVKNKLEKLTLAKRHYILDGYPRTVDQVNFLDNLDFTKIDWAILLEIDSESVIKRLSERRVCQKCSRTYHLSYNPSKDNIHCDDDGEKLVQRKDDQSDVVLRRLNVYEQQTKPLIDFYASKGILISINADQEIEKVYQDVVDALKQKAANEY
ncbi:adenylate kinase family protein [Mycoplasma sp. 128]